MGTAAAPSLVTVTARETAGSPEASVVQAGETVTRAEQGGRAAAAAAALEEEEEEEEEVEVEEVDEVSSCAPPSPPPFLFHDDAKLLLAARTRPPVEGFVFRPPETSPGISSVRGEEGSPEGVERRSGCDGEEEVFDAAAALLPRLRKQTRRAAPRKQQQRLFP